MNFELQSAIEILDRTPVIVNSLLLNIDEKWIQNNEGDNTWSPYDVIGHLIHGEKTDWVVRAKIILSKSEDLRFEEFDRFAQLQQNKDKSIQYLLQKFENLREQNLTELKSLNISETDLDLKGIHPEFGVITLRQLLSAWVVHDLGHIAQISRVMAKQYTKAVGPWTAYLKILS